MINEYISLFLICWLNYFFSLIEFSYEGWIKKKGSSSYSSMAASKKEIRPLLKQHPFCMTTTTTTHFNKLFLNRKISCFFLFFVFISCSASFLCLWYELIVNFVVVVFYFSCILFESWNKNIIVTKEATVLLHKSYSFILEESC